MNLQQFHLSNREARSVARSARFHALDRGVHRYDDSAFKAFTRSHNSTHLAVTR